MTWGKLLINLGIVILITIGILIFSPMFSKNLDKQYRKKIDNNAKAIMAVIIGKNSHKGNSVIFSYSFMGNVYKNREYNDNCYKEVEVGDSIEIMIDSMKPSNSYIIRPSKYAE